MQRSVEVRPAARCPLFRGNYLMSRMIWVGRSWASSTPSSARRHNSSSRQGVVSATRGGGLVWVSVQTPNTTQSDAYQSSIGHQSSAMHGSSPTTQASWPSIAANASLGPACASMPPRLLTPMRPLRT